MQPRTFSSWDLLAAAGMGGLWAFYERVLPLLPDPLPTHFDVGGMFYNNPEDSRLWVEKRIGIGWTLNYAQPGAWWLTAAFLVLPVAAVVMVILKLAG